ncbi:hypothetical protein RIF29_24985 [Crotalaria pallida]|uniref:RRM domain-containing protein n=1 Tax=Crotalaria pallida TaxID=3830 RepID=A0AAN9ELH9_CROPI
MSQLWSRFTEVGKVKEVFLPRKLDKFGKRFGFVRFSNQNDFYRHEEKLKNFWIRSYKVFVNRPRFEREVKVESYRKDQTMQQHGTSVEEYPKNLSVRKPNVTRGLEKTPGSYGESRLGFKLGSVRWSGGRQSSKLEKDWYGYQAMLEKVIRIKIDRSVYDLSFTEDYDGGKPFLLEDDGAEEVEDSSSNDIDSSLQWDPEESWEDQGEVAVHRNWESDVDFVPDSLVCCAQKEHNNFDVRKLEVICKTNKLSHVKDENKEALVVSTEEDEGSSAPGDSFVDLVAQNRRDREGYGAEVLVGNGAFSLEARDEIILTKKRTEVVEVRLTLSPSNAIGPNCDVDPLNVEENNSCREKVAGVVVGPSSSSNGPNIRSKNLKASLKGHKKGARLLLDNKKGLANHILFMKLRRKHKGKQVVVSSPIFDEIVVSESTSNTATLSHKRRMQCKCFSTRPKDMQLGDVCKLPRLHPPTPKRRKQVTRKSISVSTRVKPKNKVSKKDVKKVLHDDSISNSISDSNIRSCCRHHFKPDESVPQRLWSMAKQLGVNYDGHDDDMVNLLVEMENRDKPIDVGEEGQTIGQGYLEDRRPESNMDPYVVNALLAETTLLWEPTLEAEALAAQKVRS